MRNRFTNTPTQVVFGLAAASVLLVVACSRTSNEGAPFTPAAPSSSAQRTGFRAAVNVTYDPNGRVAPPNDAWAIVPGTLHATFSPTLGLASDASPAGLRLTMPYPQSRSGEILAARAPVVSVEYVNGRTLRWPALGAFDGVRHRVTVDLPAAMLEHATSVTLALGIDSGKSREEPPGPRYWTGKDWSKTGSIQSGKKTVVLIHGIFSSVESAFPRGGFFTTACPKKIADAEGFQQVLGFDYAWNEPPDSQGKLFADFLKQIVAAKVSSLSIEAHSYGSLVSLAAAPKVGSDASIANLVTMGGPLPLRGTPLAEPKNLWRISMMLGLLDWYYDEPPSVVDRAFNSGMVASLATDSDALKTILTDVKGMSNKPHFVEVAGTEWICFIPGIRSCNYSEETFKKVLVDGSGVQLPWDGVVEKIAANSDDIPDAVATSFPLSHVDLQCDDGVIKWISKQLK